MAVKQSAWLDAKPKTSGSGQNVPALFVAPDEDVEGNVWVEVGEPDNLVSVPGAGTFYEGQEVWLGVAEDGHPTDVIELGSVPEDVEPVPVGPTANAVATHSDVLAAHGKHLEGVDSLVAETKGRLDGLEPVIEAATEALEVGLPAAQQKAQDAQSKAVEALSRAGVAESKADSAQTAADQADGKATSASQAATAAQNTANAASTAASTAQTTADQAKADAASKAAAAEAAAKAYAEAQAAAAEAAAKAAASNDATVKAAAAESAAKAAAALDAKAKADAAQAAAEAKAQLAANAAATAQSKAEEAKTAADSAQSAANTASTAAGEALFVANLAQAAAAGLVTVGPEPEHGPGRLWVPVNDKGQPTGLNVSNKGVWDTYTLMTGLLVVPGEDGTPTIIDQDGVTVGRIMANSVTGEVIAGRTIMGEHVVLASLPRDVLDDAVQESLDNADLWAERTLIEPGRVTIARTNMDSGALTALILQPSQLDFVVNDKSVAYIDAEREQMSIANVLVRNSLQVGSYQVRDVGSNITTFQFVGAP